MNFWSFTSNHPSQFRGASFLFSMVLLSSAMPLFAAVGQGMIHLDAANKLVTLGDGQGQLSLRLNYDECCVLDQVMVRGRAVSADPGVYSGMLMDNQWFTTKAGIASPKVTVEKNTVTAMLTAISHPFRNG